jgi:glycogen debranching enzyme
MRIFRLLFILLFIMVTFLQIFSQNIQVGLLQKNEGQSHDKETKAALKFLENSKEFKVQTIYLSGLIKSGISSDIDLLWFHHNDSLFSIVDEQTKNVLLDYLNKGGKLLLTLDAFNCINDLDIEPIPHEKRNKTAKDDGYGRKLGLHAFRNHPIFAGLNGGAYIFKPDNDTTVRIHGYFDENLPLNGAVVAVDWDYIFLRENSKLALEYWVGEGKVLAIGGYTCLSEPNKNRQHLELFLSNCLKYLNGDHQNVPVFHWSYYDYSVNPFIPDETYFIERNSQSWELEKIQPVIRKDSATNNFWDVAGERMVIMGKEMGGIDEIWAHPIMAIRDYKTGIKLNDLDTLIWLDQMLPSIEVRPDAFVREYSINGNRLQEVIFTAIDKPLGVVNYRYMGSEPIQLFARFSSILRLMWPYSEKVFKQMNYAYDVALNSMIITEESNDFMVMVGSDREPTYTSIGQFNDFHISFKETATGESYPVVNEIATDQFMISGLYQFSLDPGDSFNLAIAAGNEGVDEITNTYKDGISNPGNEYQKTHQYYRKLLSGYTQILTPDPLFNEGYQWALVSTDRFFVHTPGIGKSLVAGYSTTNTGWDGGHKIDGRPGYSWYFGRDGQWSGLALLDYGDFDKVKNILKMYQDFQDLNGKIYHEVSTSGVVHYDAADATPLYIILAGRYLKHSGNLDFIRQSWPHIRKAINYCFSTDTDGDHLIENTNVGHGWVEGGSLFGSHSSLYLSSCWAEALEEAAYMSGLLEKHKESSFYYSQSETVRRIINNDFWNRENDFFFHGEFMNGSYIKEISIMPAIPIYFGQTDSLKISKVLPVFAGNNFTSDWGCRIVSRESPAFNPNGYHTGSVWPLFTGWISLAEYAGQRPVQGFSHLMNNLQVYQHWGLGFVEEVLNGETYKPSGVCHHQCWSETMVLQPAIEGLLGFKPNATDHTFKLSPALPLNWDSLNVKNLHVGEHVIHFNMKRETNKIIYSFEHEGPSVIRMDFSPVFPKATEIKNIKATGLFEPKTLNTNLPGIVYLDQKMELELEIESCIGVLPHISNPKPGNGSKEIRIVDEQYTPNGYEILVEGLSGTTAEVDVFVLNRKMEKIKNGKLIRQAGNISTFEVEFEAGNEIYQSQKLIIGLK